MNSIRFGDADNVRFHIGRLALATINKASFIQNLPTEKNTVLKQFLEQEICMLAGEQIAHAQGAVIDKTFADTLQTASTAILNETVPYTCGTFLDVFRNPAFTALPKKEQRQVIQEFFEVLATASRDVWATAAKQILPNLQALQTELSNLLGLAQK